MSKRSIFHFLLILHFLPWPDPQAVSGFSRSLFVFFHLGVSVSTLPTELPLLSAHFENHAGQSPHEMDQDLICEFEQESSKSENRDDRSDDNTDSFLIHHALKHGTNIIFFNQFHSQRHFQQMIFQSAGKYHILRC